MLVQLKDFIGQQNPGSGISFGQQNLSLGISMINRILFQLKDFTEDNVKSKITTHLKKINPLENFSNKLIDICFLLFHLLVFKDSN
jgi:hypothetical protein